MTGAIHHFGPFSLDPAGRRLLRDNLPIDISARYFDALVLMVREPGQLITKEQFLDQVWRGVPVTDEALTQCIRTLRRQLGDEATRPAFIETVPKHGYRFIATVTLRDRPPASSATQHRPAGTETTSAVPTVKARDTLLDMGRAGMVGGGAAGLLGGLLYGFSGVFDTTSGGSGLSGILIMAGITMIVGLAGGAGVGFGIGLAAFSSLRKAVWTIAGGAAGGLFIGALAKVLGSDAFDLLFGQSPGDITGAPEGVVLGGITGLALWTTHRLSRSTAWIVTAFLGAGAGVAIALAGGRLMGGSLLLLSSGFPESRIRFDTLGQWVGEAGFGPLTSAVSAGLEGMLFVSLVVAALDYTRRRRTSQ